MVEMIVNADDFGMSPTVNLAIDQCMRSGIISRTTVMTNMSSFDEAVKLAKNGGYLDKVGLHINLTEGIPLTNGIKRTLFCTNGAFNGEFFKKKAHRIKMNKLIKKAVADEIEAQMIMFLEAGFSSGHIDSHQHCHNNLSVLPIVILLAKKNMFRTIRLARNIPNLSPLKSLYKGFINHIIKKNHFSGGVQFFGSMDDFSLFLERKHKRSKCELMVHPTLAGGVLTDSVSSTSIDVWLKKYGDLVRVGL